MSTMALLNNKCHHAKTPSVSTNYESLTPTLNKRPFYDWMLDFEYSDIHSTEKELILVDI